MNDKIIIRFHKRYSLQQTETSGERISESSNVSDNWTKIEVRGRVSDKRINRRATTFYLRDIVFVNVFPLPSLFLPSFLHPFGLIKRTLAFPLVFYSLRFDNVPLPWNFNRTISIIPLNRFITIDGIVHAFDRGISLSWYLFSLSILLCKKDFLN